MKKRKNNCQEYPLHFFTFRLRNFQKYPFSQNQMLLKYFYWVYILGTSRQPRPYKNYSYFLKNSYINYDQIYRNHLSVDILKELSFIAITLQAFVRFFFIYGGVFIIHIDCKLGYIFNVANIILFYLGVFLCGYLKRWNETIWSFLPSNSRNNLLVSKSIL